jgi:hypothetical protein
MTEAPKKKRKLKYRPRTLAEVEEQQQIDGLRDAVYEAHKSNPVRLLAYLRSHFPLGHLEPYRHELAYLIERFIQPKRHGQRGKAVPTARSDMQARFIGRCRSRLKSMRARNGGRAPRGAIEQVINKVAAQMDNNDEFEGQEIDFEAAREALLKNR